MLIRALIVLLSVLNLGVAAWWIGHEPAPPAAPLPLPAGVARLQLVSERHDAPARPVAAAASVPTASDGAPRCFSFGPFASAARTTAAATALQPQVQRVARREEFAAAAGARGWRVFLPPLATLEEAQATAQRIGAAGFTDFLVVREGDEANSIALGRYRSEQGARTRARALAAAGFIARVAPLDGAATAVWLDVAAGPAFDPRASQAAIGAAQSRAIDCTSLR